MKESNPGRARFSAPFQTSPGANPASYTECNGSFPGVKLPECGFDHPTPSGAEVKERVELCLFSVLCAFVAGYMNFIFSAFKVHCLHLHTCRVYSLIQVCTLFIIALSFELTHSKLEGTVHAITLNKYMC
jgi:hypothetical protein